MTFLNSWFLWLLLPFATYWLKQNRQSLQQNMRWLTLSLLVIAIARPAVPQTPTEQSILSHSLTIALDLSASMNAKDIKPSRAEASRETIKTFLTQNKTDQIALIGFTINPLLLSPLTTDHELVKVALDTIKQEYILTKGTNLQKLLEKVAHFPDAEKTVILFSDGGDELIDKALILFAQTHHIKILAIAMATEKGSSITTKENSLLQDKKGHIVVSKINSGLAQLANQSGGALLAFTTPQDMVYQIESWIEHQDKKLLKHQSHDYFELYFIPTLLALILLFLSATRFLLKVVALLALLGIETQASFLDGYHLNCAYQSYHNQEYNQTLKSLSNIEVNSLESQLVLAHTYYKQEAYKKAKNILKTIRTTQPKIKQQLLYELGNCEAKLTYYDKAKNYYIKALQLGEDNDTLHNLTRIMFLKHQYNSKIGFTNPSSPEASNSSSNSVESKEKPSSKEDKEAGGSGGEGSKKSKTSTVQVVKSSDATSSKREMSSTAYDLINEGYIRETKPW
ncbi:MAG TPA: VWA domain-containing protein [Campylobacterales bacterium]|nr:VWA domain-containing protein [Campylobacterales bacterium]